MLDRLHEFPNPYDFANPVADDRLFVGRGTETADVIYYLNHAKQTKRPIHLAFIGSRAAGKTSFLNVTELEANRRGFCSVRINLNEGDIHSDSSFFRKLFHSIVMAAFSFGAYGGPSGPQYFSYLDLISTNDVSDLGSIPFVFSIQLARAAKSNNTTFQVPDDILTSDLRAVSTEVAAPIIVLFDECNVLRGNRVILEK